MSRPFTLACFTLIAVATGACNAIFGISSGEATSGTGGTSSSSSGASSSGASSSGGTSSSSSGGASCTNVGKATCAGPILQVCDATGHLSPTTCPAASLCDAVAQKCNDFPRIAAAQSHGCAIEDNQSIRCWGFNEASVVLSDPRVWVPIAEPVGVSGRQISISSSSACALQDDGTVACWGWDDDGSLGVMPTGNNQTVNAVPMLPAAVEVAVADGCSCARLADGSVDCWGTQDNGCLGTASQTMGVQFTPTRIGTFNDAVQIRADSGNDATVCVRHVGGQVTCWGPTVTPAIVPGGGVTTDLAIGEGIVILQQASGLYWTVAKADGSGWETPTSYAPGVAFTQMSAGKSVCGIEGNGTMISCGSLYAGYTPPGALSPVKSLPAGTVVDVAVGFGDSDMGYLQCLRLSGGSGGSISGNVYCWGDDQYGALGAGGPEFFTTATTPTGLPSTAISLSTADYTSSAVVQGGEVWAWGSSETFDDHGDPALPFVVTNLEGGNASVQSCDEDSLGYALGAVGSPPVLFEYGTPIQGPGERLLTYTYTDFVDARLFGHFDIGLLPSSSPQGAQVVVWAGTTDTDSDGILGDGGQATVTVGNTYVVPLATGATAFSAYAPAYDSGPAHGCAILAGGAVSCWGHNQAGECAVPGVGAPPGQPPSPVPPSTVKFPTGAKGMVSVAVGVDFSCATDGTASGASGKVYCWGANGSGQLGDGMIEDYNAYPAPVKGITNAVGVAAGPSFACAWLADKTVQCWGDNTFGELGNGDRTFNLAATPTPVVGLGTTADVVGVSLANLHGCALHAAGGVSCWGSSYDGEIGTSVTGYFPTPVGVLGL